MKKLKVLMLGWEFPPVINGGLGVACLGISKALSKKVDLTLILPKSDPEFVVKNVELIGLNNLDIEEIKDTVIHSQYIEEFKVEYIKTDIDPYSTSEQIITESKSVTKNKTEVIPGKPKGLELFKQENDDSPYGENLIDKVLAYAKYAASLAETMEFDVIHANDWMTFMAGLEIKKQSGKPLALHVHALDYDRGGADSRGWIYNIEKEAMLTADVVIPVSKYTGKIITEYYGIEADKIKPVHNGIETAEVSKSEKGFPEKMVLFLGRLTAQKGPEFFLDIAEKVIAKNDKVRFVIAGTGDKLKRLIETGAYKSVSNKFHFTGFLNKEKVGEVLGMADVYCMPSVSEPFGLSALEATQYGVPAVISKQSGVAEVLEGALKADYWDVDLMAKHILDLIEDEELQTKVVDLGYKDLKKLTWDHTADKLIKIFADL